MTPNDPQMNYDPHICWSHMCDSTKGSLCPTPTEIHWSVDTVIIFLKTLKGQRPLDDLWPHFCWGHMCDSTQVSLCPSPMQIHQSMWIQWQLKRKKEKGQWPQKTPRWPLTPHSLRSHVWLYQVTLCSTPMEYKVCGYRDHLKKKTTTTTPLTEDQWPLNELWPHFCWGHVCDSTHVSLKVCGYSDYFSKL